jgi:hypothetical protein
VTPYDDRRLLRLCNIRDATEAPTRVYSCKLCRLHRNLCQRARVLSSCVVRRQRFRFERSRSVQTAISKGGQR